MLTTVAASVAGVVVLAAASLLAYRAASQRRTARSLAIRTPNGIDESRYVPIGGIGPGSASSGGASTPTPSCRPGRRSRSAWCSPRPA